ncbi:MAG: phosphate ABC transporter ATP-binding protein [Bacteroidetes bacterium]|jgi:phosphate transport system ATP-binding protein|nr:phosphate ABC transporter ATP-binding protein [Bacteroidota bacterium]
MADAKADPQRNPSQAPAPFPSGRNHTPSASSKEAPSATEGDARAAAPTAEGPRLGPQPKPKIEVKDLQFWYGDTHAIKGVTMNIPVHQVTAFIGPSGCGKSTVLRCLNRMNELIPDTRMEGTIRVDGQDIYAPEADPVMVRRRIGMVFQKPNPFPKTLYKNITWGAKINGYTGDYDELVEESLRAAALWDEVKDRLHTSAYNLSGGQQQRLCIARALAVKPDILLMDEPASALDPIATAKLEETIVELKKDYTIVIVTHNMQQATRVSDQTAFFYVGELVEMEDTETLFTRPSDEKTDDYISGRFG